MGGKESVCIGSTIRSQTGCVFKLRLKSGRFMLTKLAVGTLFKSIAPNTHAAAALDDGQCETWPPRLVLACAIGRNRTDQKMHCLHRLMETYQLASDSVLQVPRTLFRFAMPQARRTWTKSMISRSRRRLLLNFHHG
jgi:hypothetical protein